MINKKQVSTKAVQLLVLSMLSAALLIFSGCNDDDGPGITQDQQRLDQLTASWQLGSVINDNNDVTNQFAGFRLAIEQFTYTTQNGGNAWPDQGTYSFIENDLNRLLRSDGVELQIKSLSSDELIITFQTTQLNGRKSGITGGFEFQLVKE